MINNIIEYSNKHHLLIPHSTIIVGLSGGPDSAFLLHVLAQLKDTFNLSLIAAHLDHQWRTNSFEDAAFCKNMAKQLQIPFVSNTIKELGKEFAANGSKEAQGRSARRFFLEKVAQENNAQSIALAHHLQDQEETFFIRLIRGSSLTGLCSMLPKEGNYIRPLLETNKTEILEYLQVNKIPYLIDPTNEQMTYLRNRIRAKVLPALQECDERFNINFLETIKRLQETENFLELETKRIYNELTTNSVFINDNEDKNNLKIKEFLVLHPAMQQRILIYWLIEHQVPFTPSQALLQEILRFLRQPSGGSHYIYPCWQIIKKKNFASLVKNPCT